MSRGRFLTRVYVVELHEDIVAAIEDDARREQIGVKHIVARHLTAAYPVQTQLDVGFDQLAIEHLVVDAPDIGTYELGPEVEHVVDEIAQQSDAYKAPDLLGALADSLTAAKKNRLAGKVPPPLPDEIRDADWHQRQDDIGDRLAGWSDDEEPF